MEIILSNSIWRTEYFSNTIGEYFYFIFITIILSLSFFLLKYFFLRKLSQKIKEKKIFRFFLEAIDHIRFSFYIFVSFYISLSFIEISNFLFRFFEIILIFWITYNIVIIGYRFIDFFLESYLKNKIQNNQSTLPRYLGNIAKGFLWIIAVIVLLLIFGVNITALLAGMGVGGIAIAFALQNILSDLFSSFSIYFDKPFVEGDFIVVGEKWGTVEKIGIKSTRVRALQGEEIVFSNKELTTAQVHNFGKLERRRVDFKIRIIYETPTKKMEKIPEIIKKIVEKEEIAELDRVHFIAFNDFSLDYCVVYYVNSPEYEIFMDINERILLDIKRAFEKEKIEFAYPTRTIHFSKSY